MSEIKNTKEVYQEQAVPIEEPTVDQTPTEGISTEKPGFWNVAKKICLGATIVFLLLRVIQYHKPVIRFFHLLAWACPKPLAGVRLGDLLPVMVPVILIM